MDVLNNDEFVINLKLLKQSRFYCLIDPNGRRIFSYNIFRLIFLIIFVAIHMVVIYSNLGLIVEVDYQLSNVEFFLIMFADLLNSITFYKTWILLYRMDKIMDLFDVTRIDFMISKQCCKNNKILYGYRNTINKYTNFYCIFCIVVFIQWIIFAYLGHLLGPGKSEDHRFPNVINMPFPVNIQTYNQYYVIFFVLETICGVFLLYCNLMIDVYLLSYGWIIIAQYEVIYLAFKDLKIEDQRDRLQIGIIHVILIQHFF